MRYIKLFEKFVNDVKFYRFNHNDLLGEESEKELTPGMRNMIGTDEFNEALIRVGFPNKKKCVHFLDSNAFDPSFKNLYGKNIYNIEIDDQSKLGWSFYHPINEWYYLTGFKFRNLDSSLLDEISKASPIDVYYDEENTTEESVINQSVERIKKVMEYNFIGFGTIDDLKKSPLFGKVPLFVWTEDKVLVKKYLKEVKPTEYKSQPLLTPEDFPSKELMANFYKSDSGKKIKVLQNNFNTKKTNYDAFRSEAIKILNDWLI
jgi:hypothetical protein